MLKKPRAGSPTMTAVQNLFPSVDRGHAGFRLFFEFRPISRHQLTNHSFTKSRFQIIRAGSPAMEAVVAIETN